MGKFLSAEEVLNANDITTEEVEVPEWGGSVLVRGLTALERDRFEASVIQGSGKNTTVKLENARAKLASLTVVGEDGKRLFSQADVAKLSQKSASALNRIYNVAARLSGITDEDLEEISQDFGGGQ